MISRVKCFVTGTALFLGALSAFANSTAFNGYVQINGNTGIDLSNLDGGNYRVTVTGAGQLNFRYVIGGQSFDSNPEAAAQDIATGSNSAVSWSYSDANAAYTASAVATEDRPVPGPLASNLLNVDLFNSYEPSPALSTPEPHRMQGAASSVQYSDAVSGSNFYVARVPEILDVPGSSLIAVIGGVNSGNYFYTTDVPYFGVQEVPEPATFALFGAALLGLCGVGLRRARASQLA